MYRKIKSGLGRVKFLIVMVTISSLLSLNAHAQNLPPDPADDPDFPDVPLDGGMSLLLAAGAAYYTHRKIKNSKKDQDKEK